MNKAQREVWFASVRGKRLTLSVWTDGGIFVPERLTKPSGFKMVGKYYSQQGKLINAKLMQPVYKGFDEINDNKWSLVEERDQIKVVKVQQCKCPISYLMTVGCTCGVFKAEMEAKCATGS